MTLVTACQGHREWHIARRLSFTSTTTHALIKALLRHSADLEYDYVRTVCEFMCSKYDFDKQMEEQTRRENEATEEQSNENCTQSSNRLACPSTA